MTSYHVRCGLELTSYRVRCGLELTSYRVRLTVLPCSLWSGAVVSSGGLGWQVQDVESIVCFLPVGATNY